MKRAARFEITCKTNSLLNNRDRDSFANKRVSSLNILTIYFDNLANICFCEYKYIYV
jgi:hypothetical protein